LTEEPIFVALRRPADLAPRPAPGHEPELVERIAREIRQSGPMTVARFMELALYDPDHGYYVSGSRGPGRSADFLTAPESHPIFGWALARQVEEIWELLGHPNPFTVREFGAGSGALAAGLIDGLTRSRSPLRGAIRYRIAERSSDRLATVGAADVLEADDGAAIVGLVLANEVLDALPIHQVRGAAAGDLVERFVELGADDGFRFADGPPSTPELADRLAREEVTLPPDQVAEVCLALDGWVAGAAAGLSRGLLLAIDYGHPAAALYAATRGSLLRAYVHHRVHDDPFANIGRQDLTAHVDLTAVESAAARAGLVHLGTTTQAEFLAGLGAGDLLVELQTAPGAELGAYLEARSALFRLLDPTATGRFAVLCFGRGIPVDAPLRGLSFRLPARS